MKKLFISFSLVSCLLADVNPSLMNLPSISDSVTKNMEAGGDQRDIRTMADFKEFTSTLEEALKMGQINPYAFVLGSAYLTDFNLKDGSIKKDIKKARYYFSMSLDDDNYAAAYQLAMIDVHNKEYGTALYTLDKTISTIKRDSESDPYKKGLAQSFLAVTFGSITMQFLSKDKEAVQKAITLMEETTFKDDTPTALFLLANLYNSQGMQEKANSLLSKACNYRGSSKDARLDAICKQFQVGGNK
jgi:TPR repeat protein